MAGGRAFQGSTTFWEKDENCSVVVFLVAVEIFSLTVQPRNLADTCLLRALNHREDLRHSGCH
jgi:hypothetical protein